MEKILYPRLQAAELLSVSVRKLDQLIANKELRAIRIGRRTLLSHRDLARFARHGSSATK